MAFTVKRLETFGTQMRYQQATCQFIGPDVEDQRSRTVRCHLTVKSGKHFQGLITQRVLRIGAQYDG